jgi:hypothetical protein
VSGERAGRSRAGPVGDDLTATIGNTDAAHAGLLLADALDPRVARHASAGPAATRAHRGPRRRCARFRAAHPDSVTGGRCVRPSAIIRTPCSI